MSHHPLPTDGLWLCLSETIYTAVRIIVTEIIKRLGNTFLLQRPCINLWINLWKSVQQCLSLWKWLAAAIIHEYIGCSMASIQDEALHKNTGGAAHWDFSQATSFWFIPAFLYESQVGSLQCDIGRKMNQSSKVKTIIVFTFKRHLVNFFPARVKKKDGHRKAELCFSTVPRLSSRRGRSPGVPR